MSRILAIDTATEACSAAVLSGEQLFARYEEPGRGHAERILPMVDEVLRESGLKLADLDAIAVGRGPGAFTGVRIAISVAQGLAFGAGKPVATVSELRALAQRVLDAQDTQRVLAAIDARMGEIYWGLYARSPQGLAELVGQEHVSPVELVELPAGGDWHGAGSGWGIEPLAARARAQAVSGLNLHAGLFPRAHEVAVLGRHLVSLGGAVAPEDAVPVYLRDRVATPRSQKSHS